MKFSHYLERFFWTNIFWEKKMLLKKFNLTFLFIICLFVCNSCMFELVFAI